jgi:hypothetical protein
MLYLTYIGRLVDSLYTNGLRCTVARISSVLRASAPGHSPYTQIRIINAQRSRARGNRPGFCQLLRMLSECQIESAVVYPLR